MSPQPDQRSPIALATEWVARLTVVGMEMVAFGLGGVWLDKRLKTEPLLALIGFAVGIGIGIFHLLLMTSPDRKEDKRAEILPAATTHNDQAIRATTGSTSKGNRRVSDRLPTNSSSAKPGRAFGLGWACAALSAAVVVVWLVDSVVTTHFSGRSTWEVSALAAGICWTGAMVSLVLLHVLRVRGAPLAGALLGMLVRMTIPLIIVAVATMQGGELAEAGLAGQLVAFYLITLAIETCLSVALMKSAPRNDSARAAVSEGSPSHG